MFPCPPKFIPSPESAFPGVRARKNAKASERSWTITSRPSVKPVVNPWKVTHGVLLEFQKEGSSQVQHLFYVSTNVEDFIIDQNKPFTNFLARMQPNDAMFKAASYLCHRDRQPGRRTPTFATIREKTLEYAQAVVEDDSGIPYRLFDPNVWDIKLYGQYVTPINIFKMRVQPDLVEAYHKPDVKKLDFGIGYSVTKMASNLMVAVKKKLPGSTVQTAAQGN